MNLDEYEELMHRASVTATETSREAQPTCKDCPRPNRDVFYAPHYGVHLCVGCYARRWQAELRPYKRATAPVRSERMAWAKHI